MAMRYRLLGSTALAGFTWVWTASCAPAADLDPRSIPSFASLPAVDGVNAKLQGFGGGWATDNRHLSRDNDDFRGAGGALGSLTVPLGQQFGFQADGMLASIGGDAAAGAAGHLFWRDPMRGLIGAYGSWTYWDRNGGLNAYRIGIESEAYFQRFTLSGVLGVEAGDSGTRYLTSFTTSFGTSDFFERYDIKTRFFDRLDLSYYITDNFKLSIGHRYSAGKHAGAAAAEFLIADVGGTAISLFA